MIVAGIDYSMTSPAICIWDDETDFALKNMKFFSYNSGPKKCNGNWEIPGGGSISVVPHEPWVTPVQRYDQVSRWALDILTSHGVTKVAIEGYSMGSSSGLVFNIAENCGLLKYKLTKAGIPFDTPSPGAVKKSFHGKGNANKEAMCEAFYEKMGARFCDILNIKPYGAPENDLVDSCAIAWTFRQGALAS